MPRRQLRNNFAESGVQASLTVLRDAGSGE